MPQKNQIFKERNDKLVSFLINYRKGCLLGKEEKLINTENPKYSAVSSLIFQKSSAKEILNGTYYCKKCKMIINKFTVYCSNCALKIPNWRFKNSSRQLTKRLINNGIIKKEKCLNCDEIKTEVHHTNYSKPFEIIWLCAKHHRKEHQRLKRLGIIL